MMRTGLGDSVLGARLRVVVIGDAMLDTYLRGTASRLSREAPVPIVDVATREDTAGGAANTALNLAALGAEVTLVSVVGADAEGDTLLAVLGAGGVDCSRVVRAPRRATLAKRRVVADDHLLVRIDAGSTEALDADDEAAVEAALAEALPRADVAVVSDYGYGVLTDRVLATLRAARPPVLVVDARDLRRYRALAPTAVKPNYEEVLQLLGIARAHGPQARAVQVAAHRDGLRALTGARIVAATLDVEGAVVITGEAAPYRTYTHAAPASSAAGAGDSFVAGLALALGAGLAAPDAAEVAAAAASVVVRSPGTSICTSADLRAQLLGEAKVLPDVAALLPRLAAAQARGGRIVFTNGCFDILHRGHVAYLNHAKALGDVLVVGINADESVRRLKGAERPVNALDDRMHVLAALSCVDFVVPFEEDTPACLLREVRPDVFVKGGDYTRESIPEAALVEALGGTVRILPYVDDHSTTGIIERISAWPRSA